MTIAWSASVFLYWHSEETIGDAEGVGGARRGEVAWGASIQLKNGPAGCSFKQTVSSSPPFPCYLLLVFFYAGVLAQTLDPEELQEFFPCTVYASQELLARFAMATMPGFFSRISAMKNPLVNIEDIAAQRHGSQVTHPAQLAAASYPKPCAGSYTFPTGKSTG
ncbi:MAG: hypothetical protein H6573_22225 [Lewinellaceae bacterium]|nr:hypothetical protein [Lewinellaceae bacterium]